MKAGESPSPWSSLTLPLSGACKQEHPHLLRGPSPSLCQVHYCGLCHSDVFTKLGVMGNSFPRVPGHEVAGIVDAVGPNVTKWTKGDRWVLTPLPPLGKGPREGPRGRGPVGPESVHWRVQEVVESTRNGTWLCCPVCHLSYRKTSRTRVSCPRSDSGQAPAPGLIAWVRKGGYDDFYRDSPCDCRVGVGWYGGCCHTCGSCEEGDLILCDTMPITGIMYDGGYGEYVYAKTEGLARIPDGLPLDEAAPLMCAGESRHSHTIGASVMCLHNWRPDMKGECLCAQIMSLAWITTEIPEGFSCQVAWCAGAPGVLPCQQHHSHALRHILCIVSLWILACAVWGFAGVSVQQPLQGFHAPHYLRHGFVAMCVHAICPCAVRDVVLAQVSLCTTACAGSTRRRGLQWACRESEAWATWPSRYAPSNSSVVF